MIIKVFRMSSHKLLILFLVFNLFGLLLTSESPPSHHRVRRFALTKDSKVSFDLELQLPIPSLGGVDVEAVIEFPLSITMLNDTFLFNSINPLNRPNMPYVIMSDPQSGSGFPSYMPNYYSYDSYYGSGTPSYINVMKRSIGAASAQHRHDLFASISETLDRYGIDGVNCICRAVCELSHTPLLIETPLHEILEHVLTVSRSYDEDGLLEEYMKAEKFGRSGGNCGKQYSSCAFSIFRKN